MGLMGSHISPMCHRSHPAAEPYAFALCLYADAPIHPPLTALLLVLARSRRFKVPTFQKIGLEVRDRNMARSFSNAQNMSHINTIEGIGPSHTKKFAELGVTTVEHLLKAGATPKGRKELATKTGFHEHHLLKWVNQADLFRIKGVGRQYAELLQASGVDSVKELAQRKPDHLHEKLKTSNEAKRQVHIVPNLTSLTNWISEAKKLPRVVSY